MSRTISWDTILDDFESRYKNWASRIIDWYPSGQLEVTIRLDDGTKLAYDYFDRVCRVVYNPNSPKDDTYLTEEEWRREFGIKLAKKIKTSGITQEELSEATGVSRQMLSRYMNGRSTPSGCVLTRLAETLGCSISSLMDFNT